MPFLLDTNILSELRKRRLADPKVQAWYSTVQDSELFTSVLVIGEIRRGIELKRSTNPAFAAKQERWLRWLQQDFQNKILPVTQEIAEVWGTLSPTRPLAEPDGLIAATAMCHNLILVTRNVRDVQRSGVTILNPWDA
jgi:predicted nucleic acid-binding protein